MTLEEVKERLTGIDGELQEILEKLNSDEDLTDEEVTELEGKVDELEEEKSKLNEEQKSILAKVQKRNETLEKVKRNFSGVKEEIKEKEGKKDMREEDIRSNAEYRSAFLKKLQGNKLTEKEERAMTSAENSVGAVIPTITQDLIIEKLYDEAPLLKEIELLNVNGNVTFAVEADITDANVHIEGATITEDNEVLIPVSLTTYEITKYITISKTVSKMSVDAFEKWLSNMIAKRIARKITKLIIAGTGTNQPTGVEKANTWGAANSITVAKTASLTRQNVLDLVALLPGGYDKNAKFLMSKKTLLTDFRPLQDKSKDDFIVKQDGKYFVEGYEVMQDDSVADHIAYLGDFKMYVGNLADDVTVDTDKKLSNNSYEYLGCALFDGKPAVGEAFVKLNKATA